jgi:hypothetical protein
LANHKICRIAAVEVIQMRRLLITYAATKWNGTPNAAYLQYRATMWQPSPAEVDDPLVQIF